MRKLNVFAFGDQEPKSNYGFVGEFECGNYWRIRASQVKGEGLGAEIWVSKKSPWAKRETEP